MTKTAIQDAFNKLRDESDMAPLADAAVCRSESDWLVGINGTRAMTAFNTKQNGGNFQKTPVGRVQTPTLAILVDREEKIRSFVPRTYFEVHADFEVDSGIYRGRWLDTAFKKSPDDDQLKAERIWDRAVAEEIANRCQGQPGEITEKKKPTTQSSPFLFDLTSLQREANSRFGLSARRTLQIAQALYERYKVLTYPRTDSRFLPEDYVGEVKKVLGSFVDPELKKFGNKAISNNWVKPTKRVFNNAKVSDHSAIIPTGQAPKSLDDIHQKIFDLVARRLIAIFYPPAEFEVTTRFTKVGEDTFKTEGRVLVKPGWLEVYGRVAGAVGKDGKEMVAINPDEKALCQEIEVRENVTTPPPRYSESTLLSAMEGAGKLVDDDDLADAMKEKGLGTPATRAAIIEGLLQDKYLLREGKELIPQPKGISLIYLLQNLHADVLCSPELTGEWEYKLKQMESGNLQREDFMSEIRRLTKEVVEKAKNFDGSEIKGDYKDLDVPCPKCGEKEVGEDYSFFRCANCDFSARKMMAQHQITPEEMTTLIREGTLGPLDDFISKLGKPFSASLKLTDEFKVEFDFGEDTSGQEEQEATKGEPVLIVADRWKIYESEKAFFCEDTQLPNAQDNRFRIGKTILQRNIELDQVAKLLEHGKTDLIARFISRRTNKPFDAYLLLKEGGEVGFDFPDRPKAKAAAGSAKKSTGGSDKKSGESKAGSTKKAPAKSKAKSTSSGKGRRTKAS